MASVTARVYIGGLGTEPPAGFRAEFRVRGKAPLKLKRFRFWDVQWKPQICSLFYNLEMQRNQMFVLFLQKKSSVASKLGGSVAKLVGLSPQPGSKTATAINVFQS